MKGVRFMFNFPKNMSDAKIKALQDTIASKDARIKELVDFIISAAVMKVGDADTLLTLHAELIKKDWFMTLPDFESYVETKDRILNDYEDRKTWAKKMLVNISKAGFFSSDRTIAEYNKDIWKL